MGLDQNFIPTILATMKTCHLQTLQARQKWLKSTTNLKVGDCVIIKDDTLKKEDVPSLRIWPLAIIVKTYPGKDGHVRAVDLRCNGHVYNRES